MKVAVLQGLKVIELATYIAAPGAGGMLSDWGAQVIKIEAPGGDPIRQFFDTIGADTAGNPVFDLDNRGKQGIVLDITKPEGRDIALRLLATADVFLTNLRPGALSRAGLDWDTVSALNPRLIMSSVTGYGLEGAEADKPGFDLAAFWARSGVAALTIPRGRSPFPCAPPRGTTPAPWPRSPPSWPRWWNGRPRGAGGWWRPRSCGRGSIP